MFQLKIASSRGEIEQLRSAWESLQSPSATIFQSYTWNRLAAEIFGDRQRPYFVLAENDNGSAILPAVIDSRDGTVGFAGEQLFDYRDYLVRGDETPLTAAWRQLASLDLPLEITAVRSSEKQIWKSLSQTHFSRAPHLLYVESGAVDFTRRHPRAFSRLRRLERMGMHVLQYSGGSPVLRCIYESRARERIQDDLFQDSLRVEFMVTVCREMSSACEVFTLEDGSTLAAALVTFRDGVFRRFYTLYYDRKWAHYSPGVTLLFEVARRSLEQGLSLDLMTGEQPYKSRIATSYEDLYRVNASSSELRHAFEDIAATA